MKKIVLIYLPLFSIMMFSSFSLRAKWEPVNNGIEKNSTPILNLFYSENTLFATTTSLNHDSYGLYKSNDFGENWELLGLENEYLLSVLKIGSDLFVGTSYNGVFYSPDDGKNWEQRNSGLKDWSNNSEIKHIPVFNIVNVGDTLFCACMNLYFSTDFGKSWNKIDVGPNRTVEDVYACNGQLFLNIWQYSPTYDRFVLHSSDYGNSWAFTNIRIDRTKNNEFISFKNKIFFCNGSQNIFISDDNGESWNSNTIISPIVSISAIGDTLFALSENGRLYYSTNQGLMFNIKNDNQVPLGDNIYKTIIHDKIIGINRNSDELFLLPEQDGKWEMRPTNIHVFGEVRSINKFTEKLIINSKTGIYTSSNLGNTWNKLINLPELPIVKIDTIGTNIVLIHPKSFSTSTDGGDSWTETMVNVPGTISSIRFYKDIYLCSTIDEGVFYSIDQGLTWTKFEINKDINEFSDVFMQELPFPYENRIYAISPDFGIAGSGNNGKSWIWNFGLNFNVDIGDDFGSTINGYTLVEFNDKDIEVKVNTICLYMQYRDVVIPQLPLEYSLHLYNFKSSNWQELKYKFKPYLNLLDPLVGIKGIKDKLFAFPVSGGVFYSPDLGDTWIDKSKGAEYVNVFDIQSLGDYMFITTTNGVFREKISEFEVGITENDQKNIEVYPNPASDYLTLNIPPLEKRGLGGVLSEIRILDIYGNCVLNVGAIHELPLRIGISTLTAGVYFIRIGNEKPIKFMKM